MGLPWERNWDELCDRFCLAFLTDFRENPSTLSTDGDVVAAEDIALLGETHREVNTITCQQSDERPQSSSETGIQLTRIMQRKDKFFYLLIRAARLTDQSFISINRFKKKKCQTFAGFSFLNVRNKWFSDVFLGSGTSWWEFFATCLTFYRLNDSPINRNNNQQING